MIGAVTRERGVENERGGQTKEWLSCEDRCVTLMVMWAVGMCLVRVQPGGRGVSEKEGDRTAYPVPQSFSAPGMRSELVLVPWYEYW